MWWSSLGAEHLYRLLDVSFTLNTVIYWSLKSAHYLFHIILQIYKQTVMHLLNLDKATTEEEVGDINFFSLQYTVETH